MSRRWKWVAFAAFVMVALGISTLIFLWSSLDGYVERVIEREGTAMTGTRVEVASVELSLSDGKGVVRSLVVANPRDFSSLHAFDFGAVSLTLDAASLAKDVLVVEELRIERPVARFEIDAKGLSNLQVLKKNTESYDAGKASSEGKVKDLRVRRVVIEGGTVEADASALGKGKETLQLRTIELSNVGGKSGAPPDAVGREILLAIETEVIRAAARRGLERAVEKEMGSAKDKLRSLFKR